MSTAPGTIHCEQVGKLYRLGRWGTLRDTVARAFARGRGDGAPMLCALRDVTFTVEPGQALAIIGANGAGKTTLLRLLSRIARPTWGRIEVAGRCSSLIELGAGFHPELSGRENIFLNGAILGLGRQQIRRRLDEIVAFSGLERFLDTPVKRYSSGMYVRLGFSVAAHIEPDVLLIDEVLAVGDATFRHRCLERLEALRAAGTSILFVSHNAAQVRRVAPRTLLLVDGRPEFLGATDDALAAYRHSLDRQAASERGAAAAVDRRWSVLLGDPALLDAGGRRLEAIDIGDPLRVQVRYRAPWALPDPFVHATVLRSDGTVCCRSSWRPSEHGFHALDGDGEIALDFPSLPLVPGVYRIQLTVTDAADRVEATGESGTFSVRGATDLRPERGGVFVTEARWRLAPTGEQRRELEAG